MTLHAVGRQIGLTERLAEAFGDKRRPSYVDHTLRDLLTQRIFQVASANGDGNDTSSLRAAPMSKLEVERKPPDTDTDLASTAIFLGLESVAKSKDIYCLAKAFVD